MTISALDHTCILTVQHPDESIETENTKARLPMSVFILSHHKDLNKSKNLMDDRRKNGAAEFEGELFEFGSVQILIGKRWQTTLYDLYDRCVKNSRPLPKKT